MNVIINKVEANKMLMILSYYYTEASGTNFKYHQTIMSAWELTPLANFNLAIVCPPGTENLYKSPQVDKKAW